jgi:hypothetical protein
VGDEEEGCEVKTADYWKQVREVCDKATAGPWKAWKKNVADWTTTGVEGPEFYDDNGNDYVDVLRECFRNAEFIAMARTALPEALDEIDSLRAGQQNDDRDHRRLTAEIERLRTALERAVDLLIIVPRDTDDEDKIDEVATVIHAALGKP